VSVAGSDVGVECTIIGVQSLALVPPPSCPFEVRGLFVFDSTSTYLRWTTTPCASSYDIVRGTLPGPAASGGLVNLGTVTCLVNDLVLPFGPDPTTYNGPRDGDVPPAGEAFFYVVRDWPPLWGNSLWLFERGRDGSP